MLSNVSFKVIFHEKSENKSYWKEKWVLIYFF